MHWFFRLGVVGLLLGCTLSTSLPPSPTPIPTATPVPTPVDPDGWQVLAGGLEARTYQPPENLFGQLWVLRIDPNLYTFRAHYQPDSPQHLDGWRDSLPGAAAFVNANFFHPDNSLLGLLVADGATYGEAFRDRGGMFYVQNGQAQIRSNVQEPYAGEPLEQAVQAFPMLVLNGQPTFAQSGPSSRRTVIAQDAQGRVLLMATPLLGLSLADLSAYLVTTDLGIVSAFNLDGGGSTMLYVNAETPLRLASLDRVPAVLAVYPR